MSCLATRSEPDRAMTPSLKFQSLFRNVLSRQVEYSYSEAEDRFTTMIPLDATQLQSVVDVAMDTPFSGEWAWGIERFSGAVGPDAFLFRLDWHGDQLAALTLYCRFPSEPDALAFRQAIRYARPLRWEGPDPSAVAASLGTPGPRGIAFRVTLEGNLRTALYFKCEQHAGATLSQRLPAFLAACGYPDQMAASIEADLKGLYRPGPAGVIGIDEGEEGVPRTLKFDPSNVPLDIALTFLAQAGVSAARIAGLRALAVGLRAEAASYVGVQYGPEGRSGWRLYFSCEPSYARAPGKAMLRSQRNLLPLRRLPHY